MKKIVKDQAETLAQAPDIQQAARYYQIVFGAEFDCASGRVTIGGVVFQLRPGARRDAAEAQIETADADVTVARGAAKGGRIIEPVADCAMGGRVGVLRDPFGRLWRIRSGGRRRAAGPACQRD